MDEVVKPIFDEAKKEMKAAIDHLNDRLSKIRTGKADPGMLDNVHVEYYGAKTPLNQLGNVTTPDGRTLMIHPWDPSIIQAVEKGIRDSDLGLNPQNDGEKIIINIPPLTEERRKDLVKNVRSEAENARVSIRNARREANDALKKQQKEGLSEDEAKEGEKKVQALTDDHIEKVDNLVNAKEEDIMNH